MNSSFCCKVIVIIILISAQVEVRIQSEQDSKPENQESQTVKGLRLSAEVATKVFKPTSTVPVKLKLENTSEARVYIHKQLGFGSGGFRIAILDSDNRWVPPNLIPETFPTPVLSKDDLQAIEPGKSIEEIIDIRLRDYEIIPGDYTLKIEYVSPVAVDAVPAGLVVLTSDDASLQAKSIRFKVLVPVPQ